jgi:hypothetical protein
MRRENNPGLFPTSSLPPQADEKSLRIAYSGSRTNSGVTKLRIALSHRRFA